MGMEMKVLHIQLFQIHETYLRCHKASGTGIPFWSRRLDSAFVVTLRECWRGFKRNFGRRRSLFSVSGHLMGERGNLNTQMTNLLFFLLFVSRLKWCNLQHGTLRITQDYLLAQTQISILTNTKQHGKNYTGIEQKIKTQQKYIKK